MKNSNHSFTHTDKSSRSFDQGIGQSNRERRRKGALRRAGLTTFALFLSGIAWAALDAQAIKINFKAYMAQQAEAEYNKGTATAVAGVRGRMMRRPCSPITPYVKTSASQWKAVWKQYGKKDYAAVLAAVANATDNEGVFLRGMARYQSKGMAAADLVRDDLQFVVINSNLTRMVNDAVRTLALIDYEEGNFQDSLIAFEQLNKRKQAKDVDDLSYLMLVSLSRQIDDDDRESKYMTDLKKYCSRSALLKNFD